MQRGAERWIVGLAMTALGIGPLAAAAPANDPFPASRSASRIQAATTLSGGSASPVTCLTPFVASGRQGPSRLAAPARKALALLLQGEGPLPGERRSVETDGTIVRFTTDRGSIDRVDPADEDADGRPDAVEAAAEGAMAARRSLAERFETGGPPPEIVLARLGGSLEGLTVAGAGRDGRGVILLDSGLRPAAMRRAAAHQASHASSAAWGLPTAWGEAFASFWVLRPEWASAEPSVPPAVDRRLAELRSGLGTDDLELASGNAIWFAFLEEAYGETVVRLSVEELSRGNGAVAAFDRALRRAAAGTIDGALREFSLWTLLTGRYADTHHFSFASRAGNPVYAATAFGLPSLSVQAEPELAGSGIARVSLRPEREDGGMTLRFEGDPAARWDADLVLFGNAGTRRRVPLRIEAEGKGEVVVPLGGVTEAVLLIRNLDPEDRQPHRYSWSATAEPGYPFELGLFEAVPTPPGIVLRWETTSERRTLGFDLFRARRDGGVEMRVNPVWIPAIGDAGTAAAYQYHDADVEPGVAYVYRIEAVTEEGLAASSGPVTAEAP